MPTEGMRHRTTTGTSLASALGGSQQSLHTLHRGTSRPVITPTSPTTSQLTDSDNNTDVEEGTATIHNGGVAAGKVEFGLFDNK